VTTAFSTSPSKLQTASHRWKPEMIASQEILEISDEIMCAAGETAGTCLTHFFCSASVHAQDHGDP
jgi:hypothetical protein